MEDASLVFVHIADMVVGMKDILCARSKCVRHRSDQPCYSIGDLSFLTATIHDASPTASCYSRAPWYPEREGGWHAESLCISDSGQRCSTSIESRYLHILEEAASSF